MCTYTHIFLGDAFVPKSLRLLGHKFYGAVGGIFSKHKTFGIPIGIYMDSVHISIAHKKKAFVCHGAWSLVLHPHSPGDPAPDRQPRKCDDMNEHIMYT